MEPSLNETLPFPSYGKERNTTNGPCPAIHMLFHQESVETSIAMKRKVGLGFEVGSVVLDGRVKGHPISRHSLGHSVNDTNGA